MDLPVIQMESVFQNMNALNQNPNAQWWVLLTYTYESAIMR